MSVARTGLLAMLFVGCQTVPADSATGETSEPTGATTPEPTGPTLTIARAEGPELVGPFLGGSASPGGLIFAAPWLDGGSGSAWLLDMDGPNPVTSGLPLDVAAVAVLRGPEPGWFLGHGAVVFGSEAPTVALRFQTLKFDHGVGLYHDPSGERSGSDWDAFALGSSSGPGLPTAGDTGDGESALILTENWEACAYEGALAGEIVPDDASWCARSAVSFMSPEPHVDVDVDDDGDLEMLISLSDDDPSTKLVALDYAALRDSGRVEDAIVATIFGPRVDWVLDSSPTFTTVDETLFVVWPPKDVDEGDPVAWWAPVEPGGVVEVESGDPIGVAGEGTILSTAAPTPWGVDRVVMFAADSVDGGQYGTYAAAADGRLAPDPDIGPILPVPHRLAVFGKGMLAVASGQLQWFTVE